MSGGEQDAVSAAADASTGHAESIVRFLAERQPDQRYAQPVSVYVLPCTSQKLVVGVQGGASTQLGSGPSNEHSIPPSHVPAGSLPCGHVVPVGAHTGALTMSTHGTKQNCVAVQVDEPQAKGPSAGGGVIGASAPVSDAASGWSLALSAAAS